MTDSKYDKIADKLMNATGDHITLRFDEVQGLLREYRERHLALEATLLFHSGQPWDKAKSSRWTQLTKSYEATTKALCDHIRKVLGAYAEHIPDVSESPTGRLNVETKPAPQNIKPEGIRQNTIRELERLRDRREEVRRQLDAGEITLEQARAEFPESY